MKNCAQTLKFVLLFIVLPFMGMASRTPLEGYFISQGDDTIHARLLIDIALLGQVKEQVLNTEVAVVDSLGAELMLTPKDIKGFGFRFKGKQFNYVVKPVDNHGHVLFVQPLLTGSKAALFYYRVLYYRASEDRFTFQKQDGSYLFLSAYCGLEIFRNKLSAFFADNKELSDLINESFHNRGKMQQDLAKVIEQANISQKTDLELQQRLSSK